MNQVKVGNFPLRETQVIHYQINDHKKSMYMMQAWSNFDLAPHYNTTTITITLQVTLFQNMLHVMIKVWRESNGKTIHAIWPPTWSHRTLWDNIYCSSVQGCTHVVDIHIGLVYTQIHKPHHSYSNNTHNYVNVTIINLSALIRMAIHSGLLSVHYLVQHKIHQKLLWYEWGRPKIIASWQIWRKIIWSVFTDG